MASPHPHHHLHHHNSHPSTTIPTSCCCCCCCTPSPHPPPPDPLLQSLASHLLHTPPDQPHLYSPYFNTPYDPHNLHHHHHHHHHQTQYHPPQPHQQKQQRHHQNHPQPPQIQPTVSSLVLRIAALESSLRHQFSANSTAAYSLRDAAARTIQTHFRAFLVRRSRTLRQLKDLAFIKSTLNTLKTSLSDNTHFNSQALSRKAMDLLLKLDSIQGFDSMIRDGKRSISRELIRFIEFIDGVSSRRKELSSRATKNVRFVGNGNKSRVSYNGHRMGNADCGDMGGNERELKEKLRVLTEKINGFSEISEEDDEEDVGLENPNVSINGKVGFPQNRNGIQPKAKKNVRFAENGNVYRVFKDTHEPISSGDVNSSDGSGSIDDERELVDNLCREVEEIGGFAKEIEDEEEGIMDDGGSSINMDGERNPRRSLRAEGNYEINGQHQGQNGNFTFSAPLPVKMESKADLIKKNKS
ncbi:BAG family molecular chaperone regulator 8, chloroplastic [Cornus florida]|uniref:BAG family molecular chaperone regulator 8, chloroplastic n=1 Tax=Cornus florida TaxID=4283 RepID=UPI00289A164D|nr:BAG family molecular chaperone regulator 8, chloroplastic [Cornus florida]